MILRAFIILTGVWFYMHKYKQHICKKEWISVQTLCYRPEPLRIDISGYHWNIAYQLGVSAALQEFLNTNYIQWHGCSFGALISTALHLDLPLMGIYNFLLQLASQKGLYFIWNFNKIYRSFIDTYYNNKTISYPVSYIFTKISLKNTKWIEVKNINYQDILKMAYHLPFPVCIPKKIEPYGYIIDAYWGPSRIEQNNILISLESTSHIPPPLQLQYKNLFYSDKIKELYTIGYKRAFIKLHSNAEWEPYFKEPKKTDNIRLCRSYLNDIDELCMNLE